MLSRLVPLLGLGLISCADPALRSVCQTNADCARGDACEGGSCVPAHVPDAPPPPESPDFESCAARCGTLCCAEGMECRNATCVPRCRSEVWCGPLAAEVCCAETELCGPDRSCVPKPPEPPSCPEGQWDSELASCVPAIELRTCDKPSVGVGVPEVLWEVNPTDGFEHVIVMPIVIDVDGDGVSEVLAPFYSEKAGIDGPAVLRALSGADGAVLWSTSPLSDGAVAGTSQLAAAVLQPGGPVVVIGQDVDRRLSAFDARTGSLLWRSRTQSGAARPCDMGWGAPALVDLDGDTRAEVVCGFTVFDSDGVLKEQSLQGSGPLGPLVAIGDLDGDGRPDVTDGTTALRHDGALLWKLDQPGGLPAIADLVDMNGYPSPDGWPEVVVTRFGQLEVRDGRSGVLRAPPILLPTWDGYACYPNPSKSPGVGGAPAISDLNGDGQPEVVVASGECLATMGVVFTDGKPEWRMYWGEPAIDESSAVTGVALFDLDGDGLRDVVHASETRLDVMQGSHGAPLFRRPHCSGTLYEFPAIADVDGDGSANIVVARNTFGATALGCPEGVKPGIVVLRERRSLWSNARAIFNQHSYTATNVCDGADDVCAGLGEPYEAHGALPQDEHPHWLFAPDGDGRPWNFVRANSNGPWRARAAANARISHLVQTHDDASAVSTIKVRVVNDGEAPLRAGTAVKVRSGTRISVVMLATPGVLAPGTAVTIAFDAPAEWACNEACPLSAEVDVGDRTAECDEGDNVLAVP